MKLCKILPFLEYTTKSAFSFSAHANSKLYSWRLFPRTQYAVILPPTHKYKEITKTPHPNTF